MGEPPEDERSELFGGERERLSGMPMEGELSSHCCDVFDGKRESEKSGNDWIRKWWETHGGKASTGRLAFERRLGDGEGVILRVSGYWG